MEPFGLQLLGIKVQTLFAGFSGSTVHLLFSDSVGGLKVLVVTLGSTAIAVYSAPFMAELLELGSRAENGAAFFIGLSAMEITPGLLKVLAKAAEDPLAFISRWRGK